jgi:hypothetical protein
MVSKIHKAILVVIVFHCLFYSAAWAVTISEQFNNGQFNSHLFNIGVFGQGPSYQVANGRLEITLPADSTPDASGAYGCYLYTNVTITGDYDVRVDYTLLTWPTKSGAATIVANTCSMERRYFDNDVYNAHMNGTDYRVNTSDTTGTLRVKKTGNTIQAFYLNAGSWQLLGSNNNPGVDKGIGIEAYNYPPPGTPKQDIKIAFDNFIIYAPQMGPKSYNCTQFDIPDATGSTAAFGINNGGTVVGSYDKNGYHGFIRSPGGSYTTTDVSGAANTLIYGINTSGRVVGGYGNPAIYTSGHGFIYDSGTYTFPFDVPSSLGSYPAGINSAGEIVGQYSQDGTFQGVRGFFWSNGSFTTLTAPGAVSTEPRGINDGGIIVGSYGDTNSINHGFVRLTDGSYITYDVPGAKHTVISGINNHGIICGFYHNNDGAAHGFVYDGGSLSYINVAGAQDTQVWGINDLGQVAGAYKDYKGIGHGFTANPKSICSLSPVLQLLMLQ